MRSTVGLFLLFMLAGCKKEPESAGARYLREERALMRDAGCGPDTWCGTYLEEDGGQLWCSADGGWYAWMDDGCRAIVMGHGDRIDFNAPYSGPKDGANFMIGDAQEGERYTFAADGLVVEYRDGGWHCSR